MTWLRFSALSGPPFRPVPAADGTVLVMAGHAMVKPALRRHAIYAALAASAFAAVAASFFAAPGLAGLFGAALGLLMLAIAVSDARAFRIPDRLTLAALLLALAQISAMGLANLPENIGAAVLRGAVLGLVFLALREMYFRLRRRHGIGLGDVKLAMVAGAWLDWPLIPAAVEIAALMALIAYSVSQLVLRRPMEATAKLPFGLFFAPAIWFCWLAGTMFLQN